MLAAWLVFWETEQGERASQVTAPDVGCHYRFETVQKKDAPASPHGTAVACLPTQEYTEV